MAISVACPKLFDIYSTKCPIPYERGLYFPKHLINSTNLTDPRYASEEELGNIYLNTNCVNMYYKAWYVYAVPRSEQLLILFFTALVEPVCEWGTVWMITFREPCTAWIEYREMSYTNLLYMHNLHMMNVDRRREYSFTLDT